MNTALDLLVLAGIAAAAWQFLRAAFRFLRHGATGIWTDEMARLQARRGDLTALQDTERERRAARRGRTAAALESAGWAALVVAPSLTPWGRGVYAGCAALWLLPLVRRRGPGRGDARGGEEVRR